MKKFMFVLFAVILAVFSSAAVFAQETDTLEVINWEDVEPNLDALELEGDFYAISNLGLIMWIPDGFIDTELTDEDIENGYVCYLSTEEGDAIVAVVAVQSDLESLDEYAAILEEMDSVEDVELGSVNGLYVVSYMVPEDDTMTAAFFTENGVIIEFTFWPESDEGFSVVASIMAASIQEAE